MTLGNDLWQTDFLAFVAKAMPSRLVILQMHGFTPVSMVDGQLLRAPRHAVEGRAEPHASAGALLGHDGAEVGVAETVAFAPVQRKGAPAGGLVAVVENDEARRADARLAACAAAIETFIDAKRANFFQNVIDAAGEGIVITTAEPAGEIVYVNDSFARMTGFACEHLIGQTMRGLLLTEQAAADYAGLDAAEPGVSSCVVSQLCSKTGHLLETEVCIVPLATPAGSPVHYAAIHRDQCERLDRELAVARSERRFRSIVEYSRDWFALVDVEGHILYESSSSRMLGMESAYRSDMSIFAHVHADDIAGLRSAIQAAIDDASRHPRVNYRISRGNRRYEAIIVNRLADPDVGAIVVTSRDISDRALIDEHIARADRLASLGTLAGGVAHEINNPLTYIASNLDFIQRCVVNQPTAMTAEITDAIQDANDGVKRVQRVVRELGEFSSPRVGDSPVDVRAMLNRAITLAQNEIRHRAVLEINIADSLPSVYGSEPKLTQVFLSLLLNAAQAIPDNTQGLVAVTAAIVQGAILVEVADSGPGIPAEIGTQVFDPFFTTKEVGKGTGLGLSFCHATVTAMGGSIVHAPRAGGGTVFSITFPPASQQSAPVLTPRARVLVIDDEPLVTRALGRLLEVEYECDMAVGGEQALEKLLGGEVYDCIFCDVMMPGVSGADVFTRVLLQRPEMAGRFVFLTGGSFTPQASQFLSSVANPTLLKPVDIWALKAAIDDTMRKGGSLNGENSDH